ncbi:hypothetical protein QR680_011979 [Steinernema hermaphroditum]|uniref:Uncharacterized protein n=1 Tax=Steinernema hermaphroditum TaxID=289476 RepID=A0AA39LZY5_9BILA|nr:hypothetical protein QR680_011979 [Steinernema hermaphroditum]
MKLLHDLDESATQLTTEFRCRSNEISESVRALLGTRQATTEDVTSEQVEHDVPEPLVETSSEINENVESCEPLSCRERPMGKHSQHIERLPGNGYIERLPSKRYIERLLGKGYIERQGLFSKRDGDLAVSEVQERV